MTPDLVPATFAGLIDDAALFPPGNAPMADAVPGHGDHRAAWYADMIGPFLCPDNRLTELRETLPEPGRLDLGLIVTGGAGAIEPAAIWAGRDPRLRLTALEIGLRDEPEPGRNVARIELACRAAELTDRVRIAVEIPPGPGLEDALDALATTGFQAKLRTGPHAPTDADVADFILACLDREVAFKCTAGLHHAVRHSGADGAVQHGFLNLLLATAVALDGGTAAGIVELLADTDAARVADAVRRLDDRRVASTRHWFTSYGSCSIAEPVADLESLGLLTRPT